MYVTHILLHLVAQVRVRLVVDGVRAGAKRLGRKETDNRAHKRNPELERLRTKACVLPFSQIRPIRQSYLNPHMNFISRLLDYIPPMKPYELSNLVYDLVRLSRYLLKPNGRLVFFLPTATDEYEDVDVNNMLCDGMEVIANSLQDFGSWGRRVCGYLSAEPRLY